MLLHSGPSGPSLMHMDGNVRPLKHLKTHKQTCTALYINCTWFYLGGFLRPCSNIVTKADLSLLVACAGLFSLWTMFSEPLRGSDYTLCSGLRKITGSQPHWPIKGGIDGRNSVSFRGASGSAVNYINGYRLSLRGVLFQVGPLPVERQEEGEAERRYSEERRLTFWNLNFTSSLRKSKQVSVLQPS